MHYFLQLVWFIFIFVLALTGIVIIVLKGYDYYLIKKLTQSRRRIGFFTSDKAWSDAVKGKCCDWLVNMPRVQVTDNINFIFLEKIMGKYSNSELQAWQQGGLLIGIAQYLKKRPDETGIITIINNDMEKLFDNNYMWRTAPEHIDYALLAYAIMKLPVYNDRYFNAMTRIADVIKNHIGYDGTIYYRSKIPNYRLVDTIGMICPFLIRYGSFYNKVELIDLALNQIKKYAKYGVHHNTNIPAHAYHADNKMPLGIYGWGRGTGWYALGLIDSYEELNQSHMDKEFIKNNIILLADAIIKYQRSDGGWGQYLFIDNNTYDSSATAMLVYFLKKGVSSSLIKGDCYINAIEKGTLKLKLATRVDGTVDFSQGDTKGIAVYSTVFREFPFTQGMALRILSM